MKLSEQIKQLQQEARDGKLTIDSIEDGFNRCIEDAEFFEDIEAWKPSPNIDAFSCDGCIYNNTTNDLACGDCGELYVNKKLNK